MYYVLGLDVGGTKCAVSLGRTSDENDGDHSMNILAKEKFETANKTPMQTLQLFYEMAEKLLAERKMMFSDLAAIGISCGGPLDSKSGMILSPPNLPGWDEIEIVRFFEEKTGVATFLQNDANACAAAEWQFGAGRGCENMIFLTFGTGLGAGMILNGQLYGGASDMAGEIGHVRLKKEQEGKYLPTGYGKAGSAEGYCSGGGLAQIGRHMASQMIMRGESSALYEAAQGNLENITARLMAELARKGDPVCKKIYEDCGTHLGEILAILIDVINPEKIILGGIYMRCADLLMANMEEVLKRETLSYARTACRIVPAGLGEAVGDYAALSVAVTGKKFTVKKSGFDRKAEAEVQCEIASEQSVFKMEMNMKEEVRRHLDLLIERYPVLESQKGMIAQAYGLLAEGYHQGGKLLICGNGGSAADSEHIVGELMKSFLTERPLEQELQKALAIFGTEGEALCKNLEAGLPAVSLCGHPALTTAFSNDAEPVMTFAQQVLTLGKPEDMLLAISTSGNSKNCVYAAVTAKAKGMKVLAMTGKNSSRLSELADVTVQVPSEETFVIQEYHLPVYHCLCAMLECEFFGTKRRGLNCCKH